MFHFDLRRSLFSDFELRKSLFLAKLRSESGYKRYLGSPLRYAGGKTWAVGYVVENLPARVKRVVSPFFGGGSVEVALAKELGVEVLGFDVFEELVTYWRVQVASPEALYQELKKLKPDRETFFYVKERLKRHVLKLERLDDVTTAAYFFFNYNLSYGPSFLGWPSSTYLKQDFYERALTRVKNFRVSNVKVECESFEKVLPAFKKEFLLLDPPYYLDEGNVFTGIYPSRNDPVYHENFPHELLRDLLYAHEGGFLLFYNDAPTIRRWYAKFRLVELNVRYTMGQGETRIGKNRKKEGTHVKVGRELLIVKEA